MSDSTGTVVWRANYLPFGEEMIDQSTVQNNKMFVGKEKDSESGLYYFGARYMDPGAGRFTSPDPIGAVNQRTGEVKQLYLSEPLRLNAYVYAGNNPYRNIDMDGRIYAMYDQKMQRMYIYSNDRSKLIADFSAKNEITRSSVAQFPMGEFTIGSPDGPRDDTRTDTGKWFIPILDVDGRTEMGIHGGGTGLDDPLAPQQGWQKTLGCIRVQNSDLESLVGFIQQDIAKGESNKLIVIPDYPSTGGSQ